LPEKEPKNDTARRDIDFLLDPATNTLTVIYDPDDVGGSRTELTVSPWTGKVSFWVDESRAAGVEKWLVEVTVIEDNGELKVRYRLPDAEPILA